MTNIKLYKKLLCKNIIEYKQCEYNNKCLYAHSLTEQQIDLNRKQAYDLFTLSDLSHINLSNDKNLYKILLLLANICQKCTLDICQGGYNCKYGAISQKYKICLSDINYGKCYNNLCLSFHPSQRGLIPYFKTQKQQNSDTDLSLDLSSNTTVESEYDELANSIFYQKK